MSRPPPRRSRPAATALVAGGLAAIVAFAASPADDLPPGWVAALLPGVSTEIEVVGGAEVDLAIRGDGAEKARAAIDRRAGELGGELAGDRLRLPGVEPERAGDWARDLLRPGRLELVEVASGSELMERIYARVARDDPRARELGVEGGVDAWEHEQRGRRLHDWYLTAIDRDAVERYLAELPAIDPTLAPGPGLAFRLERGRWPPFRGDDPFGDRSSDQPRWRSYLVRADAALDNRHVADARLDWDPVTNQPEVSVQLTGDGADRFAELTGRITGHKLAILLDGEVTSAPIIMERIPSGRLDISLGPGDAADLEREAETLAAVLRATPLPPGVDVAIGPVRAVAPSVSAAGRHIARGLLAMLVGLALGLIAGALERRADPIDPIVSRAPRAAGPLWRRAAVTAAGVALAAGSGFVLLPGIELETVLVQDLAPPGGPYGALGAFALGITPFFASFVLVEIAALLVPRWRPLRHGRPRDRGRLALAGALLGVALAALQAWLAAEWLLAIGDSAATAYLAPIIDGGSLLFQQTFAVLLGGATLLALLALVVDRFGLGGGFAAVLFGGAVASAYDLARWLAEDDSVRERVAALVAIALCAALTSAILRWRARPGAARFQLPTAGIVPVGLAAAAAFVIDLLAQAAAPPPRWLTALPDLAGGSIGLELAALVALSLALSWAMSRPPRTAAAAELIDRSARRRLLGAFAGAAALSAIYLVALVALERGQVWVTRDLVVSTVTMALATAIVMDLIAEVRALARRDDLVPVWPLHQVQQVDWIAGALTRSGIDAHPRALPAQPAPLLRPAVPGGRHGAVHPGGRGAPADLLAARARPAGERRRAARRRHLRLIRPTTASSTSAPITAPTNRAVWPGWYRSSAWPP